MRQRTRGVVIKDYPRVDAAGVLLRKPKKKYKHPRTSKQIVAEARYRRTAKGIAAQIKKRVTAKRAIVPLTTAEHQRIVALYAEAARRTAETGIAHHVDHDRPLALGGLHHPDNLIVVPAAINLAKGARYASLWEFLVS